MKYYRVVSKTGVVILIAHHNSHILVDQVFNVVEAWDHNRIEDFKNKAGWK